MNPVTLTTHNGGFHADDVFACATLELILEKEGRPFAVSRSRDPELMAQSDIVFDVGGVYDPAHERFDHHQEGGAGKREDGIPYAAFGLVWKKYGEQLCGSEAVARRIEKHIVEPIDAFDNGIDLFTPLKKISGLLLCIRSLVRSMLSGTKKRLSMTPTFSSSLIWQNRFLNE